MSSDDLPAELDDTRILLISTPRRAGPSTISLDGVPLEELASAPLRCQAG